jgi:hypothetical protein
VMLVVMLSAHPSIHELISHVVPSRVHVLSPPRAAALFHLQSSLAASRISASCCTPWQMQLQILVCVGSPAPPMLHTLATRSRRRGRTRWPLARGRAVARPCSHSSRCHPPWNDGVEYARD